MKSDMTNTQQAAHISFTPPFAMTSLCRATRLLGAVAVVAICGSAFAQSSALQGRESLRLDRRDPLPGSRMSSAQRQALAKYSSTIALKFGDNEVPAGIMGPLSNRVYPTDAAAEARAAIEANGAAFRMRPNDSFAFKAVEDGAEGVIEVRMQQLYNGVPVEGGELRVHLTADRVVGISGRFFPDLDVPLTARGDGSSDSTALAYAAGQGFVNAAVVERGKPVIFMDEHGSPHFANALEVTYEAAGETTRDRVFVDASEGTVLATRTVQTNAASTTQAFAVTNPNIIRNPGFESGNDGNWTGEECRYYTSTLSGWYCQGRAMPTYSYSTAGSLAHSGYWYGRLNGNAFKSQDRMCQTVLVPEVDLLNPQLDDRLSFYLSIQTAETGAWDYLYVQIQTAPPPSGYRIGVLSGETLASYSNVVNANLGYKKYDLSIPKKYWGKTVSVCFVGVEDASVRTTFLIDDVSLFKVYGFSGGL